MAEESILNTTKTTIIQTPSPKDIGYFIADIISIASVYKDLVVDDKGKEEAIRYITAAFDKWLELVSPIEYIPGLVEKLDKIIKHPFWDIIPELTEDLFERILIESVVFKEELFKNNEPIILEALAETIQAHAIILLEKLSGDAKAAEEIVLETINTPADPSETIRKAITIIAVALTLSLNKK
ncbi:hypothetical protein J4526_05525 [Desulfurococcaceae archaeon MEX13E-LK6-19]|nr:hypothetical protein J4526_05525 [Desulfurococcaceae archaeon MEX13E-LK6-19]